MSHTGTSHGPLSRPVQWVVFEVSCDPVLTQTRSIFARFWTIPLST